jgi:thioredoxin reductase
MKIENYDRVQQIVGQIRKHEATITELSSDKLTIYINHQPNAGFIDEIGAHQSSTHHLKDFAIDMVRNIRQHLRDQIAALKQELETL